MNPHHETTTQPSSTMPPTSTTSNLPSSGNPLTSTYDNTTHAHTNTHPHTSDSTTAQNPLPATAHGQTYDPTIKPYQLEDRATLANHSHLSTHNPGTHISHSPSTSAQVPVGQTRPDAHNSNVASDGQTSDGKHNYSHVEAAASTKISPADVVNVGYPRSHKNHHYIIGKKYASDDNHVPNTPHQHQENTHLTGGNETRRASIEGGQGRRGSAEVVNVENREHKNHHYIIGSKQEKEATHMDQAQHAGERTEVYVQHANLTGKGSSESQHTAQIVDEGVGHGRDGGNAKEHMGVEGGSRLSSDVKKMNPSSGEVVNPGYPREGPHHYQQENGGQPWRG